MHKDVIYQNEILWHPHINTMQNGSWVLKLSDSWNRNYFETKPFLAHVFTNSADWLRLPCVVLLTLQWMNAPEFSAMFQSRGVTWTCLLYRLLQIKNTFHGVMEICLLLKQAHKDIPTLFPYRELENIRTCDWGHHKKAVSHQAILASSILACVFIIFFI